MFKNFNDANLAPRIYYGGDAGSKQPVYIDGEVWMLKFPKSTRDFVTRPIPYTTSPLSEYIGSQIYETLGIPVHETMLGEKDGKVVVACKDFTREKGNKLKVFEVIGFNEIKNIFMSSNIEEFSGTGSGALLDEVLATIDGYDEFYKIGGIKERFWDMFVVDAFIANNDRNNGNWGLLQNLKTNELSLTPVFDNGNAFFNKRSLQQMGDSLTNQKLIKQDAYQTPTCIYTYIGNDGESHHIKPMAYIEQMQNQDCNNAILRFCDRINMNGIKKIIDNVPEQVNGLQVMPRVQKEFYLKLMQLKLDDVIIPTANILTAATQKEKCQAS